MLGQVGHPVLDTSPLNSDGTFRLDPLVPAAVLNYAEGNGGVVTATVTAFTESMTAPLVMPLRLVQSPSETPYLTTVTKNVPIAISVRPGAFGVYCTAQGDPRPTGDPNSGEPSGGSSGSGSGAGSDPGPTANGAQNQHTRCLPAHVDHEHWRNTITGEINTADDMSARYSYAYQRHHDSTISLMVKPPGSGWQIGGSVDKHQGAGWDVTTVVGENQSRYAMMVLRWLHEGDYRWESGARKGQPCGDNEQAYPDGFRGDLTTEAIPHDEGPSQNNRCKDYDSGHRVMMQRDTAHRRYQNHAHTFGWAGTWMETGYSARSGFSEEVWTRWRSGLARSTYWICGRGPSGFANWTRVYAGPTSG
jgi:hypothetical protein